MQVVRSRQPQCGRVSKREGSPALLSSSNTCRNRGATSSVTYFITALTMLSRCLHRRGKGCSVSIDDTHRGKTFRRRANPCTAPGAGRRPPSAPARDERADRPKGVRTPGPSPQATATQPSPFERLTAAQTRLTTKLSFRSRICGSPEDRRGPASEFTSVNVGRSEWYIACPHDPGT
jgi:hypothetical protein